MAEFDRESMIQKITALLARADNAGSEHEAFAAAAKVSELMEKYSISQVEIAQNQESPDNHLQDQFVLAHQIHLHRVPLKWASELASVVAQATQCKCSYKEKAKVITFYGLPESVEHGLDLLDTMLVLLNRLTNKGYREVRSTPSSRGFKTNFRQGFIRGLSRAFNELQRERSALSTTALAVLSDALEEYVQPIMSQAKVAPPAKPTKYNAKAFHKGYQSGLITGRRQDL